MEKAFLTLNTEMHTAKIHRIATDAQGKYVLTASNDKTAKLWDSASGRLLQTYRPPIGEGNEGMLYACALSPDGQEVACGGWTSKDGLKNSIYIFNASTGILEQQILGFPSLIQSLAFSPNGRYLAVSLGRGNGVRVFRRGTYREIFRDSDYSDRSNNLSFSASGQLASVALDGYLRLYDSDLTLLKKTKTTGGSQPFSIAFSPDGTLIAIGYDDSPKVQVLDSKTLELAYEPDITDADEVINRLLCVAFSQDGKKLIAGGVLSKYNDGKWWYQLRYWKEAGQGGCQDFAAAGSTILDVKPLPSGNVLYGGGAPDWGIITPQTGEKDIYKPAELFNYRSVDKSHFKVSRAGFEIGFKPVNYPTFTFDVGTRTLGQASSNMPTFQVSRGTIEITKWQNSYQPRLNNKPLSFLKQYESCRAADIANDEQSIIFGADFGLYKLDNQGNKIWNTRTQAMACAVKITGNNELVAAALSNGRVCWYRMSDGALLLSLYLHPDQERWVLWTPSGYYDASAGAEELIGWHVNQGADKEGLFYPISRFRSQFYRPDVIDIILEELDEKKALERANTEGKRKANTRSVLQELPPKVRILSPGKGETVDSTSIKLKYSMESPDGTPIQAVKILVDGRPVGNTTRAGRPSGTTEEITVDIPSKDCTVAVIAENEHGSSEATSTYLTWRGKTPVYVAKPKLYLLAVGVSTYQHLPPLQYAAKDAQDFAAAFAQQKGMMYSEVVTKILTNDEATKDDILDGLDWIVHETTSKDLAVLFFSGHGLDNNAGTFFFMPQAARTESLRRTGVMKEAIKEAIATIPGKVITFMDACHAGGLMKETRRGGSPDISRILNEFASAENGSITYSSSTGRQYSLENTEWQNGAFTKALVEGLEGKAKASDGRVTCKSLDGYVTERVKALTKGKQSPVTNFPPDTPDFTIAVF
ncbi:caspase family protein [Lewinella cohaerens]|uniref:caspase family protein n=1 Tax=Lewinella cohaerens TaxID=70995 RepID=UPI000376DD71|nr:caspase family protein [Lewinella cohaerens]